MRITHVITGLSVGGAEMMLYKLLSSLRLSEFESEVISLTPPGKIADRILETGISVRSLNLKRGKFGPVGLIRLAKEIHKSSPHMVQTWMYHADLCGGVASKLAGRFPVIWGIRNGVLDKSNKKSTIATAKICAALSSRLPAKITCVSQAARDFHERFGYFGKKLEVIPNGFDLSHFKPDWEARSQLRAELKLPSDSRLVGLIARFDPQKDHENFVSAAVQVRKQLSNVFFVLCGDGIESSNQSLFARIASSGVSESFRLLGRRDDIAHVTAALDVAVNCSSGEGFANSIGEAMSCGIPCVVTDVGESAQVVGVTGLVVPPRTPRALADGICALLTHPDYSRLSAAARDRIHTHFDIQKISDQYVDLYRGVLRRN